MVHVFCPFLSHWLSSCLITISYQGSRVPCLLSAPTRHHNKITHCHKNLRQENTNTLGETSATKLGEYWSTVKIRLTLLTHAVFVRWMKWLLKMLYVRINLKEKADLVNLHSLVDRWLQGDVGENSHNSQRCLWIQYYAIFYTCTITKKSCNRTCNVSKITNYILLLCWITRFNTFIILIILGLLRCHISTFNN